MRRLLLVVMFCACIPAALAETTTGGVNWLDTLAYSKPAFISITRPNEITAAKYYVNMGGGNDSNSCTSTASPCNSMRGLAQKGISNLRGGGTTGAYVYVRGTGVWKMWG